MVKTEIREHHDNPERKHAQGDERIGQIAKGFHDFCSKTDESASGI